MATQRKTPTPATRKLPRSASARPTPTIATEHDIASRAYELFMERGGEHGRDWDDWLSAERELLPAPR
jgi:hypothetical protein